MKNRKQLLTIGKLDAARRQLDAGLLLYFNDGDPVAVHSLTAAAHGLYRDLSAKAGTHMLVERSLLQSIGPEFTDELLKAMRAAQNFFKHADRDAESTLNFSPESTDLLLLDCAAKHLEMTGEQTILQRGFEKWFTVHYPQFWKETEMAEIAKQASSAFGAMSRKEFLREFMATAVLLRPTPVRSKEKGGVEHP